VGKDDKLDKRLRLWQVDCGDLESRQLNGLTGDEKTTSLLRFGTGESVQLFIDTPRPGTRDWCFREHQYGTWLQIQVPCWNSWFIGVLFSLLDCDLDGCRVRDSSRLGGNHD
jgi:hypothetical protein